MDILKNPDTWLSLVTLMAAVFALFQTGKQIRLSNKHQLFEKRIQCYMRFKGFVVAYEESRPYLSRAEQGKGGCYLFLALFRTGFGEAEDTRGFTVAADMKEQAFIFQKGDALTLLKEEFHFVFEGDCARLAARFIGAYEAAVRTVFLYLYQSSLEKIEHPEALPFLLETVTKKEETAWKEDLHRRFEALEEAYRQLAEKEVEQRMKAAIALL